VKVLRIIKGVNKEGKLTIQIPKELGDIVEVIIFPVSEGRAGKESVQYFECVAEDGTEYRVRDWTEEEFNKVCEIGAFEGDDTVIAVKGVYKEGEIRLLEPLPSEIKEADVYIIVVPERGLVSGGRDWTDEEWQKFSLHSFANTEDDDDIDWEVFFGVEDR